MSCLIPPWIVQARDPLYQRAVLLELSQREKERATHRTSSVSTLNTARKFFPGKSTITASSELSKFYSVAVGRDPINRWGNRYSNIEPYDRTRVIVGARKTDSLGCGEGEGRYLNGSWVRELHGQRWWIAAQAPLRETTHSFLTVLDQTIGPSSDTSFPQGGRVRIVVQLTLNVENGRIKAYPYIPLSIGDTMTFAPESGVDGQPYVVTLREQTSIEEANCTQSVLSCSPTGNPNEAFTFVHFLYTAWPDHGVPEEADQASLLTFLRLVDKVNQRATPQGGPDSPIMVHCSAGVGRTGTFIALSSLLRFYNLLQDPHSPTRIDFREPTPASSLLGPLSQSDPVAQEIDALREQRPEMVQRAEQAMLIYQILAQAFSSK